MPNYKNFAILIEHIPFPHLHLRCGEKYVIGSEQVMLRNTPGWVAYEHKGEVTAPKKSLALAIIRILHDLAESLTHVGRGMELSIPDHF